MKDYKSVAHDVIKRAMDYSDAALTYFNIDEIGDIADDLASNIDCLTYGDACVMNVKQKPYLHLEIQELLEQAPDLLQEQIDNFTIELENEFPYFTVQGRMGGYWGLENVYGNVIISPQGRAELEKQLQERYIEFINTEDKTEEQREQDLEEDMDYVYDFYLQDIYETLLEDTYNFKFDDDYVFELEEIRRKINEKEEEMNTKEFWENFLINEEE